LEWKARRLLRGTAGQVRPRRSKATRRLSASPAESEAPGTEINSPKSPQTKIEECIHVYLYLFVSKTGGKEVRST